jgi:hypothetical protein
MANQKRTKSKKNKQVPQTSTIPSEQTEVKASEQTENQESTPDPHGENGKPKEGNVATSWNRKEVIAIVIQALIALGSVTSVIVVYLLMSSQIDESKKTAYIEFRPYVVPLMPVRRFLYEKEAVSVPIVNLGKTPAFHFFEALIYERSDSMTADPNAYWAPPATRLRWLAPGVPDTEIIKAQLWKENGKSLYVYGTIWYDDVMGNHDSTIFAYQYEFFRGSFVRLQQYDYIK